MNIRVPLGLLVSAVLLLAPAGCRHAVRGGEPTVSILITGPVEPGLLPRAAALAEGRREQGELVWLVAGPVGLETQSGRVTEGWGILRLLELAGADALVFGPDWLELGVEEVNRLVGSADLQLLSCNLVDSLGEPLAHRMLILRLAAATVGFTSVWTDTADPRLALAGVNLLAPDRAAARTLGMLKMHCDLVGLVPRPDAGDRSLAAGYDFTIGPVDVPTVSAAVPEDPGRAWRLELWLAGGSVSDFRVVEERLADWPEQPMVRQAVESLQAVVDSVLAVPVAGGLTSAGSEALSRQLQDAVLGDGFDGFLTDRPLFDRVPGPGGVDAGAVLAAMPEPGRLAIVELTGWVIAELTGEDGVDLRWGQAFSRRPLVMTQRYRLVATSGFLARHPLAALNGYQLASEPAWRVALGVLR